MAGLFAAEAKKIKKNVPRRGPTIRDDFFHKKAGCPSAVAGLGEALWIIANVITWLRHSCEASLGQTENAKP